LGVGLTTLPHKKQFVTETGNVDNDTTLAGGVTAEAAMTLLGQSQREAQRPMGPMVAPKRQTTIGCWNVNKAGWKSWEVAKAVARNRECWSESVTVLCAYWRDEK